jgi:hypothetical protein
VFEKVGYFPNFGTVLCDSGPFCIVFNFFVVRLMALFYWKCTVVHAAQQACILAEKPLPCIGL